MCPGIGAAFAKHSVVALVKRLTADAASPSPYLALGANVAHLGALTLIPDWGETHDCDVRRA